MASGGLLPQEIICKKRDGAILTRDEIGAFVEGLAAGDIGEGQIAAFGMAVFLNGMKREEVVALTLAMRDSGDVLDWSNLPGPVTDKHSTGGVGDNVSLVLTPILAACGAFVPMISGRGLGHTGGTLDKMDAIPGYDTQAGKDLFERVVREAGCAIIGATGDLAPADRRVYAVRDVTGTVESVPLITASILSKKLAAGVGSLVLDVKAGTGAFMKKTQAAGKLARSLVEVAQGASLPASALITDMNEPLASCAGNAVEVANAAAFLTGEHRDSRLEDVTMALAGEMLYAAGLAGTTQEAFERAREALDSGHAAERFERMVAGLGGPKDFLSAWKSHLGAVQVQTEVKADRDGFVEAIATREIGLAVVALGGGRTGPDEKIDHAVGVTGLARIGMAVAKGDALALVHARSAEAAEKAAETIRRAYRIGADKPKRRKTVIRRVVPGD